MLGGLKEQMERTRTMKRTAVLVIGIALTVSLSVSAFAGSGIDYWPTWRGPQATGVAPKGDPPLTWSETENIKWKIKLPGEGSSSPVIWGEKIFFQAAIKTDKKPPAAQEAPAPGGRRRMSKAPSAVYKFALVCLDRKTGKTLWQETVREEFPHEGHHPNHGFASYSPVTDGKYVWANFGSRGLYCFDVNGKEKWRADLIKMQTRMSFGEGSSPAIAGDAIIVVMDHEGDSKIFAFNKTTGEPLWQKDRDERTSWATPVAVEVKSKLQVITSATNSIRSYDAKTGDIIWQCSGQTSNVIPTPVLGFGNVYCTSGFRGNALQVIELGHTGDLAGTDAIKWETNDKTTPYVPSPILYGDKFYVSFGNKGVVSCYDAKTGKVHFEKQPLDAISSVYASPVGAAGRIYFVGRGGTTQVIKDADTFQVLATNKLDDKIDASPAIVGNEIYLKGKTSLYCIASSAQNVN